MNILYLSAPPLVPCDVQILFQQMIANGNASSIGSSAVQAVGDWNGIMLGKKAEQWIGAHQIITVP